jgi:hypothetical protein
LIGFVLLASIGGFVFIILCYYGACVRLGLREIGFVLHNTLKMVVAFSPIRLHFSLTTDYADEHGSKE